MEIKLDSCPFCGANAALSAYFNNLNGMNAQVYCSSCKATGGDYDDIEKAVQHWNSRVFPQNIKNFLAHKEEAQA